MHTGACRIFPGVGNEGVLQTPSNYTGANYAGAMMHKYFIYWGFRQHLPQKKLFNISRGTNAPPFAHACGRRLLCTQLYILHLYACSATHGDLQVPRTRMVTYGPRSFAVSGPTIWNTLPSTLRVSTTTLGQFQSGLKTILFRLAYGTWLGAFVTD